VRRTLGPAVLAAAAAGLLANSCGGIKTVSRDGYRALLAFSSGQRYQIAVAGEKRRVEGDFDGSKLVKIFRPDLGKIWQYRPSTRRILEEAWSPTDELVPGYPLEPHFDPAAYAQRFGGDIHQIGDAVHGIHPCDQYLLSLPSGDRVMISAARDFERLPVRVEHEKRDASNQWQTVSDTQLLDVRIGADPGLFQKPKGYKPVLSYSELAK
jgi:diadenosine tetraphosphatase ApaH/serine/threonine PP2A family protein phosphatase